MTFLILFPSIISLLFIDIAFLNFTGLHFISLLSSSRYWYYLSLIFISLQLQVYFFDFFLPHAAALGQYIFPLTSFLILSLLFLIFDFQWSFLPKSIWYAVYWYSRCFSSLLFCCCMVTYTLPFYNIYMISLLLLTFSIYDISLFQVRDAFMYFDTLLFY